MSHHFQPPILNKFSSRKDELKLAMFPNTGFCFSPAPQADGVLSPLTNLLGLFSDAQINFFPPLCWIIFAAVPQSSKYKNKEEKQ